MGVELLHSHLSESFPKQRGQGFVKASVAGLAGRDVLYVSDLTFVEALAFEMVDEIGGLHENANLSCTPILPRKSQEGEMAF
jgi:hypothetical protein